MFLQQSIFLSSSMAEHSAVNRVVVGSSPTWGAEASLQVVTALFFIFATVCYEAEDHRFLPISASSPDVRTKLIDRAYTCGLFLYNSPEFVDRLRGLRTNKILSDLQEISDQNSNFQ